MKTAFSPKDRIRFDIKELEVGFILSPLTARQKSEVMASLTLNAGEGKRNSWDMVQTAIKYSLKGLVGFADSAGQELKLTFDPDGSLSDESMDIVTNLSCGQDAIQIAATQFALKEAGTTIINPTTGEAFTDVEGKLDPKA